ncbi:hypothetical protein [Sanyastnella coralliicola]|uniref:hypothetical protein n=1 Tax=Sanyastnella coralliicola TaxID=3069118 RepID=UPI0027B8E896|nr:hypothetical protein [Longitalea sp. SCSIO 12813]
MKKMIFLLIAMLGTSWVVLGQEPISVEVEFLGVEINGTDSTFTFSQTKGDVIVLRSYPKYQSYKYDLTNDLLYKGAWFQMTYSKESGSDQLINLVYLRSRSSGVNTDDEDDDESDD